MKTKIKENPTLAYTFFVFLGNLFLLFLFFVRYPFTENKNAIAEIIYYVTELFNSLFTFAVIGISFTALRRHGAKRLFFFIFLFLLFQLLPFGVSSYLTYSGSRYDIILALIESAGISIQNAVIVLFLCFVIYLFAKKEEDTLPGYFNMNKYEEKGLLCALSALCLYFLIFEIIDTAEFVSDSMGILYFSDTLDIVFSYLFIFIRLFIAYLAYIFTRQKINQILNEETQNNERN